MPSGDLEIESSDVTLTATSTTEQSAIYVISGDISITDSAVVADGGIDTDTGSVNIYAVDYAWDIKAGTSSASSTTKVYLGTNGSLKASADAWDESWSAYDYISITKSTHTHSYTSSVTTEATCTTDGVRTYTCACGDSYTEVIPATGHDYEAVVTAPTCTEDGYTTYTCSNCGDIYTVDGDPATGHSYTVTWTWDRNKATATYTCDNCNEATTVDSTVTSRNVFGVVTYTATATHDGITETTTKTSGTNLLIIGALTQADSGEVDSEETDSEVVEIIEPIEGSNTESEPEEETPTEENPTTGIALALLPMAIAFAGAIISKQRC